jgi:hypothetical protein
MGTGGRTGWRRIAIGLAVVVAGLTGPAGAQEIAAFRLTGVEGNVQLRYLSDEQVQSLGGSAQSRDKRRTFEEEIFVNTHSYVYHPNFLKIDFGVGPLFVQDRFETDSAHSKADESLYNLTARLSFLEQKPYPFVLYYEHLNPTVSLGVTQSFVQESNKVGAGFSLREPLSPVLFHVDTYRLTNEGRGLDRIVDDTVDQTVVRASRSFGADGYGNLTYSNYRLESRSGNPLAVIQPSVTDAESVTVDSRHLFGARREFQLTNLITYSRQDNELGGATLARRRDWRIAPDLRRDHSEAVSSFYRASAARSEEQTRTVTNDTASVGLALHPHPDLNASIDVHGEQTRTEALTQWLYGTAASASWRRPFEQGLWQFGAGARYDVRDQRADQNQDQITDEIHSVPTVNTRFALDRPFVILASVVVRDVNNQLIAATDYRLEVIGQTTYFEWLSLALPPVDPVSGVPIVKISYQFETGGSYKYSLFDYNLSAGLTFQRYYHVYLRYRRAEQELQEGLPTLTLNQDLTNTQTGARVDYPFWEQWLAGGELAFEHQDEKLAPFDRSSLDAYLQVPLPYASQLRVSLRRTRVDYPDSPEDQDLTGWLVRFWGRPMARGMLRADWSRDEDRGGTLPRTLAQAIIGFDWQVRQLTLRAEARMTEDTVGTSKHERNLVQMTVRRDF